MHVSMNWQVSFSEGVEGVVGGESWHPDEKAL